MSKNHLFSYPLLILIFLTVALNSKAQQRNCSAMDVLEQQIESNPNLANEIEEIENFTHQAIKNRANNQGMFDGIITIPVVVHVIYQTDVQNISDAQIQSQMEVLNDDFRRRNANRDNSWPQAADTEIEFCLANVDPNGFATTGITRKFYNRSEWGFDDEMKSASNGGVDAWPTSDYLNIWVCYLGRDYLGYAQFPGGDAATDGVTMSPQYFGTVGIAQAPFDGGRTATHEVGHWLNLRHTWGDGNCSFDDFVSDTPVSDRANYNCDIGHVSCGTTDMVQNYMDYSDDDCMNLFSQGQKDRMRAMFDPGGFRASILDSPGCDGNGKLATCNDGFQNQNETDVDCGGPCIKCPSDCPGTEVQISITFDDYPKDITWAITNSAGATVATGGNYGSQVNNSTILVVECLVNDCYNFTINDSFGDGICCGYGNGAYSVIAGDITLAAGNSFTSSESTSFCLDANCNDGIQNQTEAGIDCGGPCADCTSNCSGTEITLSITFDNYPQDVSWAITNNAGEPIISGDDYRSQNNGNTLLLTECLSNGCYDFTINDAYGDGICCKYGEGSYFVTGGGQTLAAGGDFTSSQTTNFCLNGLAPTCNDGIQNQGETGIDCGGPCADCISNCTGTPINLSITFDDYPQDVKWEIISSAGEAVAYSDDYDNQPDGSTLAVNQCLVNDCYDFIIEDAYGDGICCTYGNGAYTLSSDGNTLATGSNFGDTQTTSFCLGATAPTCNDGIQNQGETGIDCGGPCADCNSNCTGTAISFSITFDEYPQDVKWEIVNSAGEAVAFSDDYENEPDGSTLTVSECLADGCYDFIIEDAYGDGVCCKYGNGAYTLTSQGNTLAAGSNFGDSETTEFCLNTGNETNCIGETIYSENFEAGWGIWNSAGSDSYRVNSNTFANSGSYSVLLRDNTTRSRITTDNLNLSGYDELTVDFSFYPSGIDSNEDFSLQISKDGGSSYSTVETWVKTTDFNNNTRYTESVTIKETFTAATKVRFSLFASSDADRIYFDDISLTPCLQNNSTLNAKENTLNDGFAKQNQASKSLSKDYRLETTNNIQVYPNPATKQVSIELNLTSAITNANLNIVDVSGKVVHTQAAESLNQNQVFDINVESLPTGIYMITVTSDQQQFTKKLTVLD